MSKSSNIFNLARNEFGALIVLLISIASLLVPHISSASNNQLRINCHFPEYIEENDFISGAILIDVINISGINLENIMISLSDPSEGFVHGDMRESFNLDPNGIQVISGSFNLDKKHLLDPNRVHWRVRYFDGLERDEVVSSDMCTS